MPLVVCLLLLNPDFIPPQGIIKADIWRIDTRCTGLRHCKKGAELAKMVKIGMTGQQVRGVFGINRLPAVFMNGFMQSQFWYVDLGVVIDFNEGKVVGVCVTCQ